VTTLTGIMKIRTDLVGIRHSHHRSSASHYTNLDCNCITARTTRSSTSSIVVILTIIIIATANFQSVSCAKPEVLSMSDCELLPSKDTPLEFTENPPAPVLCYHCDTASDPHCGNPFPYSLHFRTRDVYMTQCEGCCIKLTHPPNNATNGQRRIQRTCTDLISEDDANFPFPLINNCFNNSMTEDDKTVCLCRRGYCNGANNIKTTDVAKVVKLSSLISLFLFVKNVLLPYEI